MSLLHQVSSHRNKKEADRVDGNRLLQKQVFTATLAGGVLFPGVRYFHIARLCQHCASGFLFFLKGALYMQK